MNIRLKLTLGIGLLFLLIMVLSVMGSFQIHNLSKDTRNILKANYNSLDYTQQMLSSLDDIKNSKEAKIHFRSSLQKQEGNVTEQGEQEVTENLEDHFVLLEQNIAGDSVISLIRKDINQIMRLNMAAIARKSQIAEETARGAIMRITIAGTLCFIIALVLFFNLPGNIANPIRELTTSIEAIAAKNYSHRVHFSGKSEFGKLATAFNVMAEKLEEYHNSNLAKLLMEKKRIETLINNMKDPVIGLDENNKILFVNNEALQISGLKKEAVIGKAVQDIAVHNDLIRSLIKDIVPVSATNEESMQKKAPIKIYADNKESYFEKETVNISIIPTGEKESKEIGHVIMLRNITLFKELDIAKTNFIATISHELKTPISSIKMSARLLRGKDDTLLNADQKQLVESIDDDATRLLRITGELLNMTQVESGNIQLNITATPPEEIVYRATDATAFLAEQNHITIETRIGQNIPQVNADPDKTAWVLVNFLTNAIRYTPQDSTIIVAVEQKGDRVVFSVTDPGKGVAKQYQEKIFERYFQVPGSSKMGSGLGLAISKEFIEAQGGSIGVISDGVHGSRFYFEL